MQSILVASGAFVISTYCLLTLLSWALYPAPYGPLTHYLSRLGNYDYNPSGAIFYNFGCILTGIALVLFFISLLTWHVESGLQRVILSHAQILGIASAIALIMIGVFSEDQGSPHMIASMTFFMLNFFVLFLAGIGLLLHNTFPRVVGLYTIIFDLSTIVFAFTISGSLTEWFTVFGSLLFVLMLVIVTFRQPDG